MSDSRPAWRQWPRHKVCAARHMLSGAQRPYYAHDSASVRGIKSCKRDWRSLSLQGRPLDWLPAIMRTCWSPVSHTQARFPTKSYCCPLQKADDVPTQAFWLATVPVTAPQFQAKLAQYVVIMHLLLAWKQNHSYVFLYWLLLSPPLRLKI